MQNIKVKKNGGKSIHAKVNTMQETDSKETKNTIDNVKGKYQDKLIRRKRLK